MRTLADVSVGLSGNERDRLTAYTIIEATNLWETYCRTYFVSSAFGAAGAHGPVLPRGARSATEEHAITRAIKAVKPGLLQKKKPPWTDFDEPKWRIVSEFQTAMAALGSTNVATLGAALAANTTVLVELPRVRHFYAHRSRSTVLNAQQIALNYTIPTAQHPTDIVQTYPAGAVETILAAWLRDLDDIIALTV